MASSYTLSFIPLTTVVVPRRSTSSPSFSLIPPPSLLGKKLLVTQPSRRCFVSKHRFLTSASTVFSVPTAWVFFFDSKAIFIVFYLKAIFIVFYWIFVAGNRRMVLLQIKSLAMGESEARKLKYPTTGTETHGYFSRRFVLFRSDPCLLQASSAFFF